mgnify:CR=1 FL=1
MPVNPDDYDDIVRKINKKYNDSIRNGDSFESANRISTGSLELDIALGGGVPIGRWTRFYGGWSSTKTLTALRVIGNAQRMGLACAYYNVEKQYDPEFAELLGVDSKKLTVVEGTTVEEIVEKMEGLLLVRHLHVIDSCTMAVSEDELEASVRDWRPGITARAWGKGFRRLNERFDSTENTAILIDQTRVDFKTGSENAAGGRVFDFQSSSSVMFRKGKWLWKNDKGILDPDAKQKKGSSGQVEPEGIEVNVRVDKSRVGRPLRTATVRLDLETKALDDLFELSKAARYYGIIDTTSVGRYEYKGHKMHGEPALREYIAGDTELQEEIRRVALKSVQNN